MAKKLLGGVERAPLFDEVMKASAQKALQLVEARRNQAGALGGTIGLLIMDSAKTLVTINGEPIKEVMVDLDVLTFEALAFSAYAIMTAYNPMPSLEAQDYDERMEAYDNAFSEVVSEAFKDGFQAVLGVVTMARGWNLSGLWNRRLRGYQRHGGIPWELFLGRVMAINKAKEPMENYPGHPLSTDLFMQVAMSHKVMAFVSTMPESYAETIKRIVTHYGFDKPRGSGKK